MYKKTKTAEKDLRSFVAGGEEMTESESVALPLGDTPMFVRFSLFLVGIDGFEPSE